MLGDICERPTAADFNKHGKAIDALVTPDWMVTGASCTQNGGTEMGPDIRFLVLFQGTRPVRHCFSGGRREQGLLGSGIQSEMFIWSNRRPENRTRWSTSKRVTGTVDFLGRFSRPAVRASVDSFLSCWRDDRRQIPAVKRLVPGLRRSRSSDGKLILWVNADLMSGCLWKVRVVTEDQSHPLRTHWAVLLS
jgi:hypothetical protein